MRFIDEFDLRNTHRFHPNYTREHSSLKEIMQRCVYLHNLAPDKRCGFVKKSFCDDLSELIMYHYFMFCTLPNPTFTDPLFLFVIFIMFLWLLTLFLILATIADDFFCPALGVISKILKLSENLAGVTILAIGNGAPDIMSSITAADSNTILVYNELLGAAIFVSGMVAGLVAIIRPFNLQPFPFLRDAVFLLVAVVWIRYSTLDEDVTTYEAISYICIYIFYLIVVIGGYLIQEKLVKYVRIDDATDVQWDELRRKSSISLTDPDELPTENVETEQLTMFGEMVKELTPFTRDEWNDMSCFERFISILKCPVWVFIKFFVPVVNMGDRKRGWCRLLNTIQCLIFPTYFVVVGNFYTLDLGGVPIYALTILLGAILAIIVYFTSQQNKVPRYHKYFAFMGFLGSMISMYLFVKEVVGVLSLFGTLLKIKLQTLGLTVLAWGTSIGDAIANTTIARQGFQRMAFAGCFGGPISNILLSMGITFLVLNFKKSAYRSQARHGVMGPVCTTFLIINIVYTMFYVLLTNFEARKSYGIFLVLIYIEFILFCFFAEAEWIHPLGSDHEYDTDYYNPGGPPKRQT